MAMFEPSAANFWAITAPRPLSEGDVSYVALLAGQEDNE
jgi:hypothetical protein